MNANLSEVPTADLESELKKRADKVPRRCPTCGGKWTTYMGRSRSWKEEEHCFGCRQPIANCNCSH